MTKAIKPQPDADPIPTDPVVPDADPAKPDADPAKPDADPAKPDADPIPTDTPQVVSGDIPFVTLVPFVTGQFPADLLAQGFTARRAAWAPAFTLIIANARGRSGQKMQLMICGNRAGPIEWTPLNIADELIAQDWMVVPPFPVAPASPAPEAVAE